MTKTHTNQAQSALRSSQHCNTVSALTGSPELVARQPRLWGAAKRGLGSRFPSKWVTAAVVGIAAGGVVLSGLGADAGGLVGGLLGATDKYGNPQQVGAAGLQLIEDFEGLELTGYLLGDGMCTIGYGHAVPTSERNGTDCTNWHITEAEAEAFLKEDTERFANNINEYFCRSFTQNQFDALVSFSYNVGYAYQKYDWDCDAPDEYFPPTMLLYTNPPQFKEGLTRRRNAEIAVFEDPVDLDPVAVQAPAARSLDFFSPGDSVETPVEIPTVIYTPSSSPEETTPSPVSTFPAIPSLFSGGISVR